MLGWWDIRAVDAKRGRMVRAPVDGLEGRLGSSGGGHYYYVGRGERGWGLLCEEGRRGYYKEGEGGSKVASVRDPTREG